MFSFWLFNRNHTSTLLVFPLIVLLPPKKKHHIMTQNMQQFFASSLLLLGLQTIVKGNKAKRSRNIEAKGGTNKQHLIVLPDFQNMLSLPLGINFTSSPAYNYSYHQFVRVSGSTTMPLDSSSDCKLHPIQLNLN